MPELNSTIKLARTHLAQALSNDDMGLIKHLGAAKRAIHDAAGALQLIEANGVVRYLETLEKGIDYSIDSGLLDRHAHSVMDEACFAVIAYLSELQTKEVLLQPLILYAHYEALCLLNPLPSASHPCHPVDLYFPDLTPRLEKSKLPANPQLLGKQLNLQKTRHVYETLLLHIFKGDTSPKHLNDLDLLLESIANESAQLSAYSFWKTCQAAVQTLTAQKPEFALGLKRWLGRLNLQIQLLTTGSKSLSEQLFREALFYVASIPLTDNQPSTLIRTVTDVYSLSGSIPADLKSQRYGHPTPVDPILILEKLTSFRLAWDEAAPVIVEAEGMLLSEEMLIRRLRVTHQLASELQTILTAHQLSALVDVAQTLVQAIWAVLNSSKPLHKSLGVEGAKAILWIEETIKHPGNTLVDQHLQAHAIIDRLNESKFSDMILPIKLAPSEQSSQKLMGDAIREVMVTLSTVEKQLDDYFRFGQKASPLQATITPLIQSSSALKLLGLPQAALAIDAVEQRINGLILYPENASQEIFSKLAIQFSQITNLLDLFVRAPDRAQKYFVFNTNNQELQHIVVNAKAIDSQSFDSVESLSIERRASAQALIKEIVATPENTKARIALVESIQALKEDAALIGDTSLSELDNIDLSPVTRTAIDQQTTSTPSLPALNHHLEQDTKTLAQLDAMLSPSIIHAPHSASVVPHESDLHDIFIDEARSILTDSEQLLHLLEAQPATLQLLSNLRRNFHTLKGGSRMVGFMSFGDAASHVEQVISTALARQVNASIDLIQFMRCGQLGLSTWLSQLDNALLNTDLNYSNEEHHHDALEVDSTLENFISQLAPYLLAIERSLVRQDSMPLIMAPHSVSSAKTSVDPDAPVITTKPLTDNHHLSGALLASSTGKQLDPIRPKISLITNNEGLRPQDFIDRARTAVMQAQANESNKPVSTPLPLVLEPVQIAPPTIQTVSDSMISIGPLRLPKPLYAIYLQETEQHIKGLNADLEQWQHQPPRPSSYDAYKHAHSLKGSAATIGFVTMKELATPLESILQLSVESEIPLLKADLQILDSTLIAIQSVLNQFAQCQYPATQANVIETLSLLYIELSHRSHTPSSDQLNTTPNDASTDINQQLRAKAFNAAQAADDIALHALEMKIASEQIQPPLTNIQNTSNAVDPLTEETFVSNEPEDSVLDEIDESIWIDFVQEADLIMPKVQRCLVALPTDSDAITTLRRDLHTLKGSSRMAGAMRMGALLHSLESKLDKKLNAQAPFINPQTQEELLEEYDFIQALYESLKNPSAKTIDDAPFISLMEKTNALFDDALNNPTTLAPIITSTSSALPATSVVTPTPFLLTPLTVAQSQPAITDKQTALALPALRMRTDVLDHLVNQASEMSSSKGRLDQHVLQLRTSLRELTDNVDRLRKQLREIEIQAESQLATRTDLVSTNNTLFDPLEFDRFTRFQELTRMLTESLNDMIAVRDTVSKTLSETERELSLQHKASKDLTQTLMRSRLVPFDGVSDRLYRVARQTAKELGKQISLEIQGGHFLLDRSILERLTGSLEHLVRNSAVHGIEPFDVRINSGKNPHGKITIQLKQQGNELELFLSDDGAGLPLERIRDVAIAKGLISDHALPTVQQLAELIFTPGFSTATSITELAGRGIGMDVVRNDIIGMGGRISLATTPQHGTQFTIRIPVTLAINQVLMIIAQDVQYAIPTSLIQSVISVKPSDLAQAYSQKQITHGAQKYPFKHLSELLNLPLRHTLNNRAAAILLLSSGNDVVAVHVDRVIGNQDAVVKSLAPVMLRIPGLTSATLLNDGQLCLIIDPVQLSIVHQQNTAPLLAQANNLLSNQNVSPLNRDSVYTLDTQRTETKGSPFAMVDVVSTREPTNTTDSFIARKTFKLAMVVDDSLTVRKVTEKLLRREGWDVLLAKDGIDALEQLQTVNPSVLLVDIEMPRMDGYDLTRNVRADERLKSIPIIMITSRIADRHRDHAFSLGVNAYMGKPYRDDELLAEMLKLTVTNT
jgi:chemosensory pili system protein ChpA (sensor histidine kinase/response regulator)